jgi:hypothetical protein
VTDNFKAYPGTVHFDDSISAIRKITKMVPGIGIIGFPYSKDNFSDLVGNDHVFLPREAFEKYLYYRPFD